MIKDLWKAISTILPPLKEVLSEDGVGSYSRYTGFMIVASTICWVTYLVIRNGVLPDLTGPAIFVSVGAGATYAVNQAKAAAVAIKGNAGNTGGDNGTPTN